MLEVVEPCYLVAAFAYTKAPHNNAIIVQIFNTHSASDNRLSVKNDKESTWLG